MIAQAVFKLLFLFIIGIHSLKAQYILSDAYIEPLKPIGLRISIPDEEGISLVVFHMKFNQQFHGVEIGTATATITKKKNGRWTYEDKKTELKKGDIVYYKIYVTHKGLVYNLPQQKHIVTAFYNYEGKFVETEGTGGGNGSCQPSKTKLWDKNGSISYPCAGSVIFDKNFWSLETFNISQWTIVEQFSDAPDSEFVLYRNTPANVKVNKGLTITPRLLSDEYGSEFINTGTLSLTRCTGRILTTDCYREGRGWNILPPLTSGRVNTKNALNFQYGRIEVKAKFPRGDWLYPVIALLPNDPSFPNLQIRIASAAGNVELKTAEGVDISGHILWGGVTRQSVGRLPDDLDRGTRENPGKLWADEYHTYGLEWTPEKVIFSVDGKTYKTRDTPNLPRNTPFYLTLGVVVGGVNEFPDNCTNGYYSKTWRNNEAKSLLHFWNTLGSWYSSWEDGATSLLVDHVKITAL